MGKKIVEKKNMSGNMDFNDKAMLEALKLGECIEAEMRDDEGKIMFTAKVCKTENK